MTSPREAFGDEKEFNEHAVSSIPFLSLFIDAGSHIPFKLSRKVYWVGEQEHSISSANAYGKSVAAMRSR